MESVDRSQSTVAVQGSGRQEVTPTFIDGVLREGPTAELVKWTGWRLCSSVGLGRADRDEICQDLRADLARRAAQYDPARSPWIAFARLVLAHRATVLFRQHVRARRERLGTDLLGNSDYPSFDLCELTVTEVTNHPGRQLDRRLDLSETIAILPPPLPEICRLIQIGHTVAEVARILEVPRSKVRVWMQHIQRQFIDRNLDQYL